MNIYDLISRAQKLRKETQLDSVSPDRVGSLQEDILKYINEFQLLASSPSLHKIYANVSAMQSDKSPKSDLTGRALKSGQLVVIVPESQTDATAGDVYRYDGPSGNTSAWTFVAKIGGVPADVELSATSANPVQNKVVTEKITDLIAKAESLQTEVDSHDVTIEDLQDNKVDKGSYEPDLSVGVADHLAGHDEPTPSEFTFRKSGGGAILSGNARVQSVKGNSVVWNQQRKSLRPIDAHGTLTQNNDEYTITARSSNTERYVELSVDGSVIKDHVYLIEFNVKDYEYDSRVKMLTGAIASININNTGYHAYIVTAPENRNNWYILMMCEVGYQWNGSERFTIKGAPAFVDLTQMYGAGNEPTTIEDFYSRIPQGIDMDAYNNGEVIHMNVDSIKSVGINAWDEEWEMGSIDITTGELVSATNIIRTKNPINVVGGQRYYIVNKANYNLIIFEYDKNGNLISYLGGYNNTTIQVSPYTDYIRFRLPADYGKTYNHDICINLSDTSINGKYYPYGSRKQSLDILSKHFPQGMKSAVTAHDEVRYNKTTQKWEAVMRIAEVDLGNFSWQKNTDGRFEARLPNDAKAASSVIVVGSIICSRYTSVSALDTYNGTVGISIDVDGKLWVRDSSYTDAASFKTAMAGVILYYELAEPIVTEIEEAFNLDYEVWNGGTEQAIADTPTSAFKADIIYGFNAYGVIKEMREQLATLQAVIAKMNV